MTAKTWMRLGVAALVLAGAANAYSLEGWLRTRDDGLEAARNSGKPVLVVTLWGDGV